VSLLFFRGSAWLLSGLRTVGKVTWGGIILEFVGVFVAIMLLDAFFVNKSFWG